MEFPAAIGTPVEGQPGLYRPGPGDPGVRVGSVLCRPEPDGKLIPFFVKELSPHGEVWRRIESAEATQQGEDKHEVQ